jgi:hypothetical protein
MTLPNDQPMPGREQPLTEGHVHGIGAEPVAAPHAPNVPTSSAKRIAGALIRTLFWSWSGRVHEYELPGHGTGLEPVAARRVPNVPSRRDKWIGVGVAAALMLSLMGLLWWWVG